MVDREKVIKGFECHMSMLACNKCPYYCGDTCSGIDDVVYDALALLKALDVTPEELERLKMCRHECKIDCLLEHYNDVKDELDTMKKAQEPVKPVPAIDDVGDWLCGKCYNSVVGTEELDEGGFVPIRFNYCPNCGQAVKWE